MIPELVRLGLDSTLLLIRLAVRTRGCLSHLSPLYWVYTPCLRTGQGSFLSAKAEMIHCQILSIYPRRRHRRSRGQVRWSPHVPRSPDNHERFQSCALSNQQLPLAEASQNGAQTAFRRFEKTQHHLLAAAGEARGRAREELAYFQYRLEPEETALRREEMAEASLGTLPCDFRRPSRAATQLQRAVLSVRLPGCYSNALGLSARPRCGCAAQPRT